MAGVLLIALTLAAFWVLVVLPQQRKVKAHQATVAAVQLGDEVMTTAGLLGTVVALDEDFVWIEFDQGLVVQSARPAIGQVLEPGTVRPPGTGGAHPEAEHHDPVAGQDRADEESGEE